MGAEREGKERKGEEKERSLPETCFFPSSFAHPVVIGGSLPFFLYFFLIILFFLLTSFLTEELGTALEDIETSLFLPFSLYAIEHPFFSHLSLRLCVSLPAFPSLVPLVSVFYLLIQEVGVG